MKEILISKLYEYLLQNNPDIIISFQNETEAAEYIKEKVESLDDMSEQLLAQGKPAYIVEDICMGQLTEEFRPSRYNYLLSVLEEDFYSDYLTWQDSGVLTYEIVSLLHACDQVFDYLDFSEENEDDRKIRYAIIRTIQLHLVGIAVDMEYLEKIDFSDVDLMH